jgi:hypothetical protein
MGDWRLMIASYELREVAYSSFVMYFTATRETMTAASLLYRR